MMDTWDRVPLHRVDAVLAALREELDTLRDTHATIRAITIRATVRSAIASADIRISTIDTPAAYTVEEE